MASFNAIQTCQSRPTSESNNNNIYTTDDNNNSISKEYEYGKTKQDNIDDPGAQRNAIVRLRNLNEFIFLQRNRNPNDSHSAEAIAKIISDSITSQYRATEDSANSKTTPSANATAAAAAAATATANASNKLTTDPESTLRSKVKQNNKSWCLNNQGTLFTRVAINSVYSETEFANKEKLKLGDFNVPAEDRIPTEKQSKYDYAINANARDNPSGDEYGDRHRRLYDSVRFTKSKSEFGDNIELRRQYNNKQLYEIVCTTTATIVAFICAIFANANTKNTRRNGWDSVDRCRRARVLLVHEWSNAYCYS